MNAEKAEKLKMLREYAKGVEWKTEAIEWNGWKFTFKEPGHGIASRARAAARIWHPDKPVFSFNLDILTAMLLPNCIISATTPDGKTLDLTPDEWTIFFEGRFDQNGKLLDPPVLPDKAVNEISDKFSTLLMNEKEKEDFLQRSREDQTTKAGQQTSGSVNA